MSDESKISSAGRKAIVSLLIARRLSDVVGYEGTVQQTANVSGLSVKPAKSSPLFHI